MGARSELVGYQCFHPLSLNVCGWPNSHYFAVSLDANHMSSYMTKRKLENNSVLFEIELSIDTNSNQLARAPVYSCHVSLSFTVCHLVCHKVAIVEGNDLVDGKVVREALRDVDAVIVN